VKVEYKQLSLFNTHISERKMPQLQQILAKLFVTPFFLTIYATHRAFYLSFLCLFPLLNCKIDRKSAIRITIGKR